MGRILCIDDDTDICFLLQRYLKKNNHEVDTAFNGNSGLKKISKEKFDVVLCDFRLPDKDGIEMIKEIKSISPETQVIIITGYSDVKIAVKAIRYGAFEYVTKPIHPEEILLTINLAIEKSNEKSEAPVSNSVTKEKQSPAPNKEELEYVVGTSGQIKQVHKLMDLVADTDMTVVVLGESGTGKEVAAKSIHKESRRNEGPFVAVDCGALPKELAGSELFGHKKGAFTGALKDKPGHFEMANGGTLFLDEIGNLTYENQVKLLRVLQERKVRKLGDVKDIDIDVRVVVATNEDLKKRVQEGEFREDLYFRINEFKIELPSLKERRSDIMNYAQFFLKSANRELRKDIQGFSQDAEDKLLAYHWPGNLREMKNMIRRATLLCQAENINPTEFPEEILRPQMIESDSGLDDNDQVSDLKTVVERAEKKAILSVLQKTAYNKSRTADILKIDRKTLYNKINAYDIDLKP